MSFVRERERDVPYLNTRCSFKLMLRKLWLGKR